MEYLEQREQSVLARHVTHGSRFGNVELALGQTTCNASFNASALLIADIDRCRRLLVCRTPEVEFPHA